MKKIAFCIIVFFSLILIYRVLSHAIGYNDFTGGVRDDITADLINRNQSPDCENVISNEKGNSLQKRKGFGLYKVLTDSVTYPCQGFDIMREQSTGNEYFIVAHGSYTSKVDASTNTDFITNRSTDSFTDFTHNDKYIYGCNGKEANWFYDGTNLLTITSYTVTEPGTALVVSALISTVTYATCTVTSTTGLVVGDSILIAGVTDYTTYNGEFRINAILGTSSFTYTLSASTGATASGTSITATPQTNTYDFPYTYTHAFFQDRYFAACSTSNPNRVWQSYYNDPINFDSAYTLDDLSKNAEIYDVGQAGERIVSLFPYNGGLMVFKSGSIYKIVGDGTPFYILEVTHYLGCNSPNSITENNGILYFFGNDSYWYSFDGNVLSKISENIKGTMDDVNQFAGRGKSWRLDTFTDFDAGITTNTYLTYSGKIVPGLLLDTFSDGTYDGWTLSGTTITITSSNNTLRGKNYYYTGVNGYMYKSVPSGSSSNIDGMYYFDVKNFDNNNSFYYRISTHNTELANGINSLEFIKTSATSFYFNYYFLTVFPNSQIAQTPTYEYTFPSEAVIGIFVSKPSGNTYYQVRVYVNGVDIGYVIELNKTFDLALPPAHILRTYYFKNFTPSYIVITATNTTTNNVTNLYMPMDITDESLYTSPIKEIGATVLFRNANIYENENGQTINYYMRTNASSTSITSDAWTSVDKNAHILVSPNVYAQWKAEFIVDDVSESPEIDKVSIGYLDLAPKLIDRGDNAICWFKSRMYCAVNSFHVESETYNNYALCYDGLTNAWWKFNGIYPYKFLTKSDKLYFADSRYGVLYQMSDNYDDYSSTANATVAIDAYYYTNQEYMGNPYTRKELNLLSLAMKRQSSGSLLIDTYINGVSEGTQTYAQTGSTPSIVRVNRYPLDRIGHYFQWRFRNSQASTPFELYSFSVESELLPLEISS